MIFTINGVNILPYIAAGGIKWSRNDIESKDAGRTMDGTMQRGRVCTKIRLDITTLDLTTDKMHTVLNAIQPEFVNVTYDDPLVGGTVTKTMYSNNVPATMVMDMDGVGLWEGITFPLIER